MEWFEALLILGAGVAAGTINTVVGSGTLITFPTLVAFGYPPVVATMSNAIGLIPGNLSGTWGYRHELRGHTRRFAVLVPVSLVGAITGAWLLLHLPDDAFETIVPVLLVIALVMVVTQRRIQAWVKGRKERRGHGDGLSRPQIVLLIALVYVVGVYGGYFAAAQGILLIGIMGAMLPDPLQRINAAKNMLVLAVNLVAGSAYAIVAFDRIEWNVVALIGVGSLAGGAIGAAVGRRLPPTALRAAIVVLGLVAIWRILAA